MKNIRNSILFKLIQNNNGISSKSFFLVTGTFIGSILLIVPVIAILYDLFHNNTVLMSWSDIALYIGAVSSLFASLGFTKVWGEKYEYHPGPDGKYGTDDDYIVHDGKKFKYLGEAQSDEMGGEHIALESEEEQSNNDFNQNNFNDRSF
jgi:hypothetical protein